MESLRWILLAAGAAFVVVVYFLGRSRRQRNHSMVDDLNETGEDDLPEFSARSLDDVDEGVGEVRIVTRRSFDDDLSENTPSEDIILGEGNRPEITGDDMSSDISDETEKTPAKNTVPSDIVVLYILAKPGQSLIGSQINSSVQAMGLKFGEMNIFHYNDGERSVFSLANMLEPGSFDPATIHDIKTSGLTVFMQLQQGDPLDDLTEMLQRSYQLAGLLDARLCNHKREPLTAQDADDYRAKVGEFITAGDETSSENPELSSET
ncbi:MAG: cell division protein ZipA C-terminal FtsZ-binding domain-containing protein [Proteobacteria bacterium]|nr:cell division protein ZipA C-terminal FtsZ-binding domain-containing protein [Pseudomonadota bacterium]